MDHSGELEALRGEQRRLQAALDRLGSRIDALDQWTQPAPSPPPANEIRMAPPQDEPPPLPAAPPPIIEEPEAQPAPASAPPEPRDSFELRLGRVWLVRLGIVILLTGLVFLGNYAYHEFIGRIGPAGKLLLIYLAGGGLCALGTWVGRKHKSLTAYGRVVLAGGCAIIYYATYAAHFIAALRVIESPLLAGALLLGLGGAFVFFADRLRSQTLAAATIGLSFYTAAINPAAAFSLFSNLVISSAAIVLLARRRWVSVSFLSLTGSYGAFAFWRFQQTHALAAAAPEAFWPELLFPAAYWLVHTAAVVLRRVSAFDPSARPVFLTLNNAAFFALAAPVFAKAHPDLFWLATALYGGVLILLAAAVSRRSRDEPFFDGAYLSQGLGLILLGIFYKLSAVGWQQAISFALLAGMLVSAGRLRHGAIYRFFAGICALIAAWSALAGILEGLPHARFVAAGVAILFAATAWLLKRQLGFPPGCDWRVMSFALLAGGLCIPACLDSDFFASALRILAITAAAMLFLRLFRLPEAAYAAQPLALCGQSFLIVHAALHSAHAAAAASAAFGLAFIHLWQWQARCFPLAGRRTWQALHSIVPVVLALWWSFAEFAPAERGPVLALIALLLLAYACLVRIRVLGLASIPFTLAAFVLTASAIAERLPWLNAAAATGLLAAQSLVLSRPAGRFALARLVRAASLALAVGMVFSYVPANAWFLTFIFTAFVFFAATCIRRSRETLLYAAFLGAFAAAVWIGRQFAAAPEWSDFIGFAVAAAAQRMGKRRLANTGWFGQEAQAILCTAIVFGAWILLHRLVAAASGGFLLTVSWSLLALAVLGAGFALRERAYRLLGLIILAGAVGRIFCIDVWQLETLYRILSFLVLGAVLLALGFLYNRHADALRRWL